MRKILLSTAFILVGWAGAAPAQQPAAQGAVPVTATATAPGEASAQVQAKGPGYTGPVFWLFGMPVHLAAPVAPPYAPNAYETFAGQPKTGPDQVMSQAVANDPQSGDAVQFPGGNTP